MTSKDSNQDQELLDRYRRASDTDAAAPSDAVRSAILAESRRVADQLADKGLPPAFDVSRPAANDSRWKITAFGTAGAALLAALLIAPRYWESVPTAQVSSPAAAPRSADSDTASPPTATSLAPTDAARTAKLESSAPSRRAEPPQDIAAPTENLAQQDKKKSRLAQNYAPQQNYTSAPLALKPAPAPPPAAPSADSAQDVVAGRPMSSDRSGAIQSGFSKGAASAARERNAPEPANLQSAAAAGDLAQTALLLDQGAAVNTRDALGRTPLLLAVAQNRLEVVRLLLARGADPDVADNAGVTPLQLAKDKDLHDVAALLERAGTR